MSVTDLKSVLGQLKQKFKTRLLDNLAASSKQTPAYAKVLVAMGPTAVRPYIESLLSYGIFDWAVTGAEASSRPTEGR